MQIYKKGLLVKVGYFHNHIVSLPNLAYGLMVRPSRLQTDSYIGATRLHDKNLVMFDGPLISQYARTRCWHSSC